MIDNAETHDATSDPNPESGLPDRAVPEANAGWLIGGRYRVAARIGSGGMAEVFRARDQVLERDVAVKVFRDLPAQPDTALGVARQQTELHALANLNHPNLVTLYDGSVTSTPGFLVLELIDGPSLSERLAGGPLPEAQVRSLAIQMAEALAYVHARHMVHRDVKPANILLGTDTASPEEAPRARLSDFGIVRVLGTERMTSVNLTVGSASYLSPEQARGHDVGPPCDIYSLGLVLMEAFTGSRPFDGEPLETLSTRITQRPRIPAPLPEPWPGLLTAMTAINPAERPTATAVAQTLQASHIGPVETMPIADPAERTAVLASVPALAGAFPIADVDAVHREPRRHRMGIIAAALIVVCVGGTALLLQRTGFSSSPTPPSAPALPQQVSSSSSPPAHSAPRAAIVQSGTAASTHTRPSTTPPGSPSANDISTHATTARPTRTSANPLPTRTAPSTSAPPTTSPPPSLVSTPPSSPATSPAGSGTPAPAATTLPLPVDRSGN